MLSYDKEEIEKLVIGQLNSFCWQYDENIIRNYIDIAMKRMESCMSKLQNKHVAEQFSPYHTVSWSVFLYYLSNALGTDLKHSHAREAEVTYYLNKVMHANDWFYGIQLPEHFWAEHPLGSVLGRAKYGDYFFVYQGTTVGGNRKNGELFYPTIGERVLMYANSTILGGCTIGNNVIISANTYLINETIPDNSIVFGTSPNITVKSKTESQMQELTKHIWQ